MRLLFVTAIFIAGGVLAGGVVVYSLRETASVEIESSTAADIMQGRQKSRAGFSQYTDLWNASGAIHSSPTEARTVDHLWEEVVRSSHKAGSTVQAQLRKAAQNDTTALTNLLQKYEKEQDANLRGLLKSTLFGVQKPEVVKVALKLTESSNPLHKIEGFELLGQLPIGERELRQAAMKAVATEDDPLILRSVISALNPKLATPMEVAQITAKLHQLSQHADVDVRRQSIVLLSRWDGSANMESRFEQALSDPSYAVRLTAIWALRDSNLRADNIKYALLNILRSDEEYTKQAALYMLRSFNLTKEESELHKQVYAELNPR